MTNETAIRIGRQHIRQTLKLTPAAYKLFDLLRGGMPSIIMEFRTEEGIDVEVRIRPRTGKILSKAVDAAGRATFHSASFRIMPVSEEWDEKGQLRKNTYSMPD